MRLPRRPGFQRVLHREVGVNRHPVPAPAAQFGGADCPGWSFRYGQVQQARNVQMWLEDEGIHARFLLRDRDTKYSRRFDQFFKDVGTQIVKAPIQAPDANAFAETWVGSLKGECLNHFLCFSLGHLDHIVTNYTRFYNSLRPHQGIGNRTLTSTVNVDKPPDEDPEFGQVRCDRLLGGLLRHYHRTAA